MRLLLLVLCVSAFGQTATKLPIAALQPIAQPVGCFVSLLPTGVFGCVPLPPPPAPTPRLYNVLAKAQGTGWNLPSVPDPATLEVHRNGVLMAPGLDYTLSGSLITFTPAQGNDAGDVVLCSYSNPATAAIVTK